MIIAVLTAVNFTHVLDFVLMMPLGPQLMRVLDVTPQGFARILSSYTFAAAVSGLLAGSFLDRLDRKRLLLWLYSGFAVATLACALADGFWTLVAARIAAGTFGGIIGGLVLTIVGDLVPWERRGAATGTVMTAFSIASVAGVPAGLWLANHLGWNASFALLAGLSAIVWVIAARVLPALPPCQGGASGWRALREAFTHGNHLWAFALNAATIFAGFTIIPFLSPYLIAEAGLTERDLPWIYFLGGACTLFTSRLIGRLADRFGKRRVFIVMTVLSIPPTLLLCDLPPMPLMAVLACTTVFIVMGNGRFVPMSALSTAAAAPERRGAFMSVNSAVQSLSLGLAADLGGMIVVRTAEGRLLHFDRAGLVAVAAAVIAIGLSLRVRPVVVAATPVAA